MNPLLYKPRGSSQCLLALNEWQEKERVAFNCAVDEQGYLLDNLTLELRVNPPEVNIDNLTDEKSTLVTIDSANRPGSLVFVVQHLTELGLRFNSARISSDGGWFHDVFALTEANGEKVRNPDKLKSIKQMLNIYMQDEELVANGDETDDMKRVETTVFELVGKDKPGLLADVTNLLMHNGCNVRSAAVWTYQGRVAFVLSVTEKGKPVENAIKLQRLQQLVQDIMDSIDSTAYVSILKVRGEVHHDRRLHQLMLREERSDWLRQQKLQDAGIAPTPLTIDRKGSNTTNGTAHGNGNISDNSTSSSSMNGGRERDEEEDYFPIDSGISVHGVGVGGVSPFRSPKYARPQIEISHCSNPDYWTVTIKCRDRTKLLFDTVCTMADMHYDIYHATIDSTSDGGALQEYYVRPRSGDVEYNAERAALLKAMLEGSIQRRFPKGLKVHVRSLDRFGCLAALAQVLRQAELSVTRAKVRTFATSNSSGHTLYVMDANGGPPDRLKVQQACQKIGGKLVEGMQDAKTALDSHHFSFSFLQRQWNTNWGGSPAASSSNGSA